MSLVGRRGEKEKSEKRKKFKLRTVLGAKKEVTRTKQSAFIPFILLYSFIPSLACSWECNKSIGNILNRLGNKWSKITRWANVIVMANGKAKVLAILPNR